ncbi:MAG TPA: F0F1 ATP synthase subunit epsilon [Dongiaceae bacterium]|jgi:F-type H+-transporting ATPase subunit epsilon|nr:F0F1 ATP synthase subunit epsilon [Dongiaceae bacterium]
MAGTLQFDLVSPERLILSEPVEMVIVPGVEGDFGALPEHANLISLIRPGVLYVYRDGKQSDRIFVGGGFAEVTGAGCTVLAEEAMPVAEIDRAKAEQAVTDAREDVEDAKDDTQRAVARTALKVAEARLAAAVEPGVY